MNIASLGAARAASSSLAGLAGVLRESVVELRTRGSGTGAGIVWGGAGLIVTNAHCIPRGSGVEARADKTWREAEVIAYHPHHDLALLAAPSVRGPLLEIRDPETLRIGELVFAFGHPLGVADALAMGVVHAVTQRGRRGPDARWVVADIRLAPGNSGGPLVDADGRLVGVNSMVVNGLGIAVPATLVRRFVDRALSQRAA
jgi:serine protease Do